MSPCIACGTSDRKHAIESRLELDIASNEPTEVVYSICPGCGLGSKDPLPSAETLKAYYGSAWQASEPRPARCLRDGARWIRERARPYGPLPIDMLDVGSKDLAFLDEIGAPNAAGLRVALDPGSSCEANRRSFGDGSGSAHWTRGSEGPSLVVSTHVMEHVLDPREYLRDLVRATIPSGGFVYIEVPAIECSTYESMNVVR
jgi:hypothetical protein